jgi:hypothetical protein
MSPSKLKKLQIEKDLLILQVEYLEKREKILTDYIGLHEPYITVNFGGTPMKLNLDDIKT